MWKPEGNISSLLIDKHLRDGLWLHRKMLQQTIGMTKILFYFNYSYYMDGLDAFREVNDA